MKILLIEDDPVTSEVLREAILSSFSGAEVAPVSKISTYLEALLKASEQDWDVLILDIYLFNKNGFDLLRRLKKYNIHTPTIVYTAHPRNAQDFKDLNNVYFYIEKKVNNSTKEVVDAVRVIQQITSPETVSQLNDALVKIKTLLYQFQVFARSAR